MALTEEQYKEYYPKTYEKAMAEEWGGKVQASPSHKTDIFDLAKAGKTYDSSKHGSFQEYWEQYKQEHGLSKYRESALSTGRAYYEVPVTASTGEAAKMGMTQAVYERYQEALREQQMAQMPSVMQYQFGAPDIPYGTATTEQIAAAEAKFIEKAKLGQITADEMAWFEAAYEVKKTKWQDAMYEHQHEELKGMNIKPTKKKEITKKELIIKALGEGKTVNEIAKQYDTASRYVREIKTVM